MFRRIFMKANEICDLRTSIEFLKQFPEELIETDEPVSPEAEIAGIYRRVGSGGTVKRPTRLGPAMIFNNVEGFPGRPVVIGMLSSRKRVARLLDTTPEKIAFKLRDCVANPIQPVVKDEKAPCQAVVYKADDPDFDVRKIIPASTNTPEDAGPYITTGMCLATHPVLGVSDITIHRLCIQDKDTISMFITPGARHIGAMFDEAEKLGQKLPMSVSIGIDPAILIAAGFEPPTTPMGFNELSIAGALRGKPIELAKCLTIEENCIAHAEYVLEGELIPNERIQEDSQSHTGYAMPEFPGYNGLASHECWLIKVKAVTHRRNPIMQTVIGPSEEHVNLAGIPTEASIYHMISKALPGKVTNVYAHPSGGGKYMAILQCRKTVHTDEGKQRQAALLAFSAFPELKHVILVDEDVDIFDSREVLWAMNTRFQGDRDIITIPGVRCHPLDPSSNPRYSANIWDKGISCKTIFDCTFPFPLKEEFQRAKFMDIDMEKWKEFVPDRA